LSRWRACEAWAGLRTTEASLRKEKNSAESTAIRVGVGGWTFAPWRGAFYPQGLPHAQELAYASTHLTSIEINGTFYRTQTPATFRKWAQETPEGFVFSVKGPRYVTHRHALKEAGESIRRFCDSGVVELGDRLGPILWQFAPTKKFDEADFGGFLELLHLCAIADGRGFGADRLSARSARRLGAARPALGKRGRAGRSAAR
jgi:uncharacterized protein YecE (DUF72 family)